MKISYNWLKNYVDFNLTPNDLGEVLTGVGLEVEDIIPFETIQGGLEGVVIGEVKECTKHPEADKLSVTKVDVGSGDLLQIVCGAPNVAAGQKVVVALVGSTLYPSAGEKLAIKKAKIRGVESFGMICAEDEIGLSESHAGIMVLNASASVGTKAADYFKVEKDFVLEIGLTPNRGDANSHIGVARDLATALNVAYKAKVNFTKPDTSKFNVQNAKSKIEVEVKDTDACPRYSAVSISNVTVADSPDWLKNKLKAIGVRSVNNVVDITNFVLHEYGQPLHAFDADKISTGKVVVKKLPEGTAFKTLDEKEVKLSKDDLMICNGDEPMCIAGVFGGFNRGVSTDTKNIFLESAYFSSTSVRKTATRLNLRTDAATHFEKGTDPNITVEALKRAALLVTEICGGEIASEITDLYPNKIEGWRLSVSFDRMIRLAGFFIPNDTVSKILEHLEIKIEKENGDEWDLLVPAFKTDVKREADVVEEILRIYGYNSFTLPKHLKSSLPVYDKIDVQKTENTIAELLSGAGFNEVWTNSVTQSKFEEDEALRLQRVMLLNSQTTELDSLRTSMLYSLLEVVAYNQNRKATDLRLFEFGKTYLRNTEKDFSESRKLVLLLSGKSSADNWLTKGTAFDFYHLKSFVTNILNRLGHYTFEKEVSETHPYNFNLVFKTEGVEVARIGSVSKSTLKKFDIKNDVFYAELNWDYLLEKSQFVKASFTELPKFPSVSRDLAMVIGEEINFDSIEKIALTESKKLLQEVSLFDVYKGDKIEKGKKSYAVNFVFQHPEKTLT
ncbi:MAG: phenylalanine--tRNA ligase subunit beta, partial [Bacteroidetes bacterium]|nr:phenylalanine--tRNA ligase subunit beta [Bacteroidota bacterium]